MKYLKVFRLAILLSFLGMITQIAGTMIWRYQPWTFKLSYNIGSFLLLIGMMPFWLAVLLALYKLNHEHFEVDKE